MCILGVSILLASCTPVVHATQETGVPVAYTNVYDLRDDYKHIEICAECVVADGDESIDTSLIENAKYVFEEDGVIHNLLLVYGGACCFARPNFFAALTIQVNGCNAVKIDFAHIPVGDYEDQKNGQLYMPNWDFPVRAGDTVWMNLYVGKRGTTEGDVWWGGSSRMLFEAKGEKAKGK